MKLALIGAGGFANEVMAYIGTELKCFVDEQYYTPNSKNILPLSEFDPFEYKILVAIGDSRVRKSIVDRLPIETKYFTYIDHSVQIIGGDCEIGEGSFICAGTIITTNVKLGKHTQLNSHTYVGHDNIIGDFFTTAPGVKVSGNCKIGNCVYMGANSSIRQKINICDDVVLGLNCGVVKDIVESGTYVGVPAKFLKK